MTVSFKTILYAGRWAVGLALLLFGSAGSMRWPSAIVFLILLGVCIGAIGWRLARYDPALFAERQKPFWQSDQPKADKIFMAVFLGVGVLWIISIGFDAVRYRWSDVSLVWRLIGAIGFVMGCVVIDRAMLQNSFAVPVVKLQPGRGQFVARGGLYRYVRHPMYAGLSIVFVSMPLLLGSLFGLAGAALLIALFAWRATLEERVLLHGLAGYGEYSQHVRYRLVPYIW